MPAKPGHQKDNSAAIAAQFGTSLKALRLYERLGMLKPARTRAGWRVFGPADLERLHAILSLKQLGLPLARIAELLKSGKSDLGVLLAVQEEVLHKSRSETDHALKLIRIARARLKGKQDLAGDDLAALVRRISATIVRWTPELDALATRTFTPEQMSQMRSQDGDPAEAAQLSEDWERIQSELRVLVAAGDPASEDALALGRRLLAMFRGKSSGDKAMWNANVVFWQKAADDPRIAGQLDLNPAFHAFVGKVFAELDRRGEFKF